MATISTIRAAWLDTIKSLTVANGFLFDLDPANIVCNNEDPTASSTPDVTNYPRAMITLEDEDYNYQPSNRLHKVSTWNIGFVVYKPVVNTANNTFLPGSEPEDVQVQLDKVIRSFQKLMRENHKLKGTARSVFIKKSWTDGGYLAPLGLVFFRVAVEYEDSQD